VNYVRLNLGAGGQRIAGFTNVDLAGAVEVVHDLAVLPWPFESASSTEIVASHVLEHFDRATGMRFLGECHRILTPGGVLHLAVPDMDRFIDAKLSGDISPLGGYKWTSLDSLLGGGDAEPQTAWRHCYMYCRASLLNSVGEAGFVAAGSRTDPAAWDNPAYAAISLYVDAIK
jgi:SAM-dependent methyltransferase